MTPHRRRIFHPLLALSRINLSLRFHHFPLTHSRNPPLPGRLQSRHNAVCGEPVEPSTASEHPSLDELGTRGLNAWNDFAIVLPHSPRAIAFGGATLAHWLSEPSFPRRRESSGRKPGEIALITRLIGPSNSMENALRMTWIPACEGMTS